MQFRYSLFRGALLGSALAAVALVPASAAAQSGDAMKRTLAVSGIPPSAHAASVANSATAPHAGSTYTVLHNFAGGSGDGSSPSAEVSLDASGNIYGTASGGGTNGSGILFKLASGGTETVLHAFGATGDGTSPDGAITIDANGNMYGTTDYGGATNNGTIWKYDASGKYKTLYSFTGTDGSFIRGRLIRDKKGNLYGTALFGGANGDGSVFKLSPKGKLTVLHSFNNTDGEFAEHGLVRDKAGNFYGVTAFGGTSGNGTVYKVAPDGTFTSLYSFTGGSDGGFLYGGLAIDKSGNLYGSTVSGGASGSGTVFKMTPGGSLTTLYSFTGGNDGGGPEGDMLLVKSNLYSAASSGGGQSCGCGVIYEVGSTGKEKVLHAFTGSDGGGYSAGVTLDNGTFYGTTESYGANGLGVVFSVTKK